MKSFKLNAVVSSILSLGMVCSGSVFASKVGEESFRKTIGKRVVICTKEQMIKGAELLRGNPKKKVEEEPKLVRCNATLNSNTFKKAKMPSKMRRPKTRRVKKLEKYDKSEINKMDIESLKLLLDTELKDVIECSEKWKNLNRCFNMKDFKELPSTSAEFISKSINSHDKFYSLLYHLETEAIMNALEHESNIFYNLQLICKRICAIIGVK